MNTIVLATKRRWNWKVFFVLVGLIIPAMFAIWPYTSHQQNISLGWDLLVIDPYPVKTSPQGFYSRKLATTVRSAGIGRMEPSLNLEHKTRWVGSSSGTFSRPF
jgi:hypothetical protein